MILYQGEILDNHYQKEKLGTLREDCYKTLQVGDSLKVQEVILACDKLAQKFKNGDFDELIIPLLEEFDIPYEFFISNIPMFEEEALNRKVEIELGKDYLDLEPLNDQNSREVHPLGILFHIAAGNVDALPAYSVIEGLLAGNINILKLPSGDRGVSVQLLSELIKIEPKLSSYIYVFDVPSTELDTLKIFAEISDAIIVWGGDVAVKAARSMTSVTTKIIEWGHKLSFGYASLDAPDEELVGMAHHMAMTNQVLCSSAQGIFVDTESRVELDKFADRFFNIFVGVNKSHKPIPFVMKSKNALELYNEKLEQHLTHKHIWQQDGISVITSDDSKLELSMLFRSIWIKMLPKKQIIKELRPHKNHLQTVGLMTSKETYQEYVDIFVKSGITRITKGEDMSRMIIGESHDGIYPLKLYTKIIEIEK
ncbi:MAG: acyl-CoA reductase [Tenericutes bacterium]|nr:acyl-CoA reductase [Mycoplasmatota bacterium]